MILYVEIPNTNFKFPSSLALVDNFEKLRLRLPGASRKYKQGYGQIDETAMPNRITTVAPAL